MSRVDPNHFHEKVFALTLQNLNGEETRVSLNAYAASTLRLSSMNIPIPVSK